MHATEWPGHVLDNSVGLLVDTVSVLISLSAATAIRFGTLGVTQYLAPLWPALVLLVGVRLGFLQALGLHKDPSTVFRRRQVVSLVAAVALSCLITALLILGLTAPFGRTGWFPFTILLLELPLGVICAAGARLAWGIWGERVVPKWARELQALRSRAGTILSGLFIAMAVVVLWQALGLAAPLLPVTLESLLGGIRVLVLSAVLFLLPGYALLALARPRIGLGPLEGLIVSAGLSVAVVPLLLYFSSLAGMELNSFSVGAIFLLLGALALGRSRAQIRRVLGAARRRWARRGWRVRLGQVRSLWKGEITEGQAFYPALALVFLMAFLVRFYVARDLSVGMWADSYHHTMISQLLVDNGGLFSSWEPYAPLSSFTYHFGFHSLAAFYHWLTGVPVGRSVIDVGQLLNGLAVPLVYVLTKRLTSSRWAGLWAAVVVAFLSPMPMYYVNWGRYPQLAGQTILPVAMLLTMKGVSRKDRCWRSVLVAGVAVSGLVLTHYRVTWMYLWFLPVLLLYRTYESVKNRDRRAALQAWLSILVIVAAASVLVSPWIWNLRQGSLLGMGLHNLTSEASRSGVRYIEQLVTTGGILLFVQGHVFVLSLLGAALAVIERRKGPLIVLGWIALLLCLAAYSDVLPVPDWPEENIFALMLALYIPVSILSGSFLCRLLHVARAKASWIMFVAANAALLVVLPAHRDMLRIVASENILVTRADEKGMEWIKEHTSEEAKFLSNSHFEYEGSLVLGSDAGWWIPLLAGRQNTTPPMTYGSEASFDPDYLAKVNAFAGAIQGADFGDAATCRLLKDNGVTHIFIGQMGGSLQPASFFDNPWYHLVYHEDRVWIFEVTQACVE